MADDRSEFKFKKLSHDNYYIWSKRAYAGLIQRKCWKAVEPGYGSTMTEKESEKNDDALSYLIQTVEDAYLDNVTKHQRARDAWLGLHDLHSRYGLMHILQIMRDFFNIRLKADELILDYIGRIMESHRILQACKHEFTDKEVAMVMLMGLPESYEPLIVNLEKDEEDITTEKVKTRLLTEEKRIKRREQEKTAEMNQTDSRALWIKKDNEPKKTKNQDRRQFNKTEPTTKTRRHTKCFCCGDFGHIAINCPFGKKHEKEQKETKTSKTDDDDDKMATTKWVRKAEPEIHKALCVRSAIDSNKGRWCLDSGATDHMTPHRHKFTRINDIRSRVQLADGEFLEITGIGEVKLKISDTNGGAILTFARVLLVPKLDGNLISVARLEEKGMGILFVNGQVDVYDPSDETRVMSAKREGHEYCIYEAVSKVQKTREMTEDLWHRRLGHLHVQAVKCMGKEARLEMASADATPKRCEVCMKGKARRGAKTTGPGHRAERILKLIHSDVVGPITPTSKGGASFFVTFTDDFSRHVTVYPMKRKSDVFEKFVQYKHEVETLHGNKIVILRSDNGGEYRSGEFLEFTKQNGIQRQWTAPRTPSQNGVAERENYTLEDMMRCLLIQSGLPGCWWAEAINAAAYIRNRCPSRSINNQIPQDLWTGCETKMDDLRVFGCRAWYAVPKECRSSKLTPKGKECVFVGYQKGTKGFKLWDANEDKIYVVKDAVFDEDYYPKATAKSTTDASSREDEVVTYTAYSPGEENVEDDDDRQNLENELQIHMSAITAEENEADCEQIGPVVDFLDGGEDFDQDRTKLPLMPPSGEIPRMSMRQAQKRNYELRCNRTTGCENQPDPLTVTEALSGPEAELWRNAMDEEISSMKEFKTWELVARPTEQTTIGSRWVFRRKYDGSGNVCRYRGRARF